MNMNRMKSITLMFATGVAFFVFFKSNTEQMLAGFKKSDIEAVLKITGVTYDGTTADLVKQTQAAWLRPAGKELWEAEKKYEEKKNQLLPIFTRMGMVDVLEPQQKNYDYIFVMGATAHTVDKRLDFLTTLFAKGVTYKTMIFLSGCRPLVETEKKFLEQKNWDVLPTTEAGVHPRLFEEKGIATESVMCINAPFSTRPDGTTYRPTMADTILLWLATNPQPGSVLVISSQPFCLYQKTVIESLLPAGFQVEVAGYEAPQAIPMSSYVDTLARTFYQWNAAVRK